MREMVLLLALAVIGHTHATGAERIEYPTRPIRVILPNGPGSTTDLLGRVLFTRISERLGKQIVVDNRPGAGGTLGMEIGARAAPDGYTLLAVAASMLTITPHVYRTLAYDPLRDFDPKRTDRTSCGLHSAHAPLPAKIFPRQRGQEIPEPVTHRLGADQNGLFESKMRLGMVP